LCSKIHAIILTYENIPLGNEFLIFIRKSFENYDKINFHFKLISLNFVAKLIFICHIVGWRMEVKKWFVMIKLFYPSEKVRCTTQKFFEMGNFNWGRWGVVILGFLLKDPRKLKNFEYSRNFSNNLSWAGIESTFLQFFVECSYH